MLNFKKIEEFAQNLNESIPKIIQDLTYNLHYKLHDMLQHQVDRMNLVNRKEFNMQSKILFITQKKLKRLESRLKIIEKKCNNIQKNNNSI